MIEALQQECLWMTRSCNDVKTHDTTVEGVIHVVLINTVSNYATCTYSVYVMHALIVNCKAYMYMWL